MPSMDTEREEQEKLREAACIGDEKALRDYIDKGVEVNSRNSMNGW